MPSQLHSSQLKASSHRLLWLRDNLQSFSIFLSPIYQSLKAIFTLLFKKPANEPIAGIVTSYSFIATVQSTISQTRSKKASKLNGGREVFEAMLPRNVSLYSSSILIHKNDGECYAITNGKCSRCASPHLQSRELTAFLPQPNPCSYRSMMNTNAIKSSTAAVINDHRLILQRQHPSLGWWWNQFTVLLHEKYGCRGEMSRGQMNQLRKFPFSEKKQSIKRCKHQPYIRCCNRVKFTSAFCGQPRCASRNGKWCSRWCLPFNKAI